MARILAVDWDQDFFQVVAAESVRGGIKVERAFVWSIGAELTAVNGEQLGQKLREALKSANATPAPVVACVGRDRVVVKELRFPKVPAADEPALVRFQAAKDLSDLPDDIVIDYAKVTAPDSTGEQHAFAVALKKQAYKAIQALCKGAGLKLAAVLPRPNALAGVIERAQAAGVVAPQETSAVLILGRRWAELSVLHKGHALLARSLAIGPALAGEVQRSLAVFTMQNADLAPPQVLLVGGQSGNKVEANLRDIVGVSVQRLEPFAVSDNAVEGDRGLYAGAVGAAHLWLKHGAVPINFADPKQAVVDANPNQRRLALYGAVAAVLLLAGIVFANRVLAGKNAEVVELKREKEALEDQYKKLAQDRLDIEALKEWEDTTVSWLDEFYDLTARFPHQIGFRLKDITAGPPAKRDAKDKVVAQISLTGVAKGDHDHHVSQFLDTLNADRHLKATQGRSKSLGAAGQEFSLKVDVFRQPHDKYTARFQPPSRTIAEMEEEPPGDDGDAEGGAP